MAHAPQRTQDASLPPAISQLSLEVSARRQQLVVELENADDPLALYERLVRWITDAFPPEFAHVSSLLEVLEEAARKFVRDTTYKSDLRYLRLWSTYATLVDRPSVVFKFVLSHGIGVAFAQLYEDYADALEREKRLSAAEQVYEAGIQRKARPAARLKEKYDAFRKRKSNKLPPPPLRLVLPKTKGTPETDVLRVDPLKHINAAKPSSSSKPSAKPGSSISVSAISQPVAPSAASSSSSGPPISHYTESTAAERHAVMRQPAAKTRRPEKLHLDLSALLPKEGGEYSLEEARARSMGLLGKKWALPTPPFKPIPQPKPAPAPSALKRDATLTVDFNDGGTKSSRNYLLRRSMGLNEPTVTINTKEALAEVFGMYNSPDRTIRQGVPGSKYAATRPVNHSMSPPPLPALTFASSNENAGASNRTAAFKPFVDESNERRENPAPAKFKPFVDSENPPRSNTPSDAGRRALTVKEAAAPVFKTSGDKDPPKGLAPTAPFSVFRAQANENDAPAPACKPAFRPVIDAEPGFRVFSRPPEESKPAPTRSTPFKPFVDENACAQAPARTPLGERQPFRAAFATAQENPAFGEDDEEEADEDDHDHAYEYVYIEGGAGAAYDEEEYQASRGVKTPLGGRFGKFNVMTPITERTYEYTNSSRMSVHSSGGASSRVFGEPDAVNAAARLAAELHGEDPQHAGLTTWVEEKTGALSLEDAVLLVNSFKPPNPCNPFDPPIISTLLSLLPEDADHYDFPHQDANKLDALQKFARKKAKGDAGPAVPVSLGASRLEVYDKLGEGGFGAVFAARDLSDRAEGSDDSDFEDLASDDEEDGRSRVALKVVKPRNLWEFHILRMIHATLPANLLRSVVHPLTLYAYRDESFLAMELCAQGSLLDMINRSGSAGVTQQGACLDELLVVFFTIELLRLLEGLHTAGFIHGDLKIDNCLLRLEDVVPATAWTPTYDPSGGGGWASKGVKLIDFGRTIDTRRFPRGQTFVAEWATDARDCAEMRAGKPWTFQADYFGLAGVIFCMLYGRYIDAAAVAAGPDDKQKLATPLKRYWQTTLWTRLFDMLLNPTSARAEGSLPIVDELAEIRGEFERWLVANCQRSTNSLKGLLKKVEMSIL
ncbi:hypothetical protein K488DRAFT_49700 [Vararia minispora EC-137]|uniref:Uncharacterized protein n=1 Tax=Vararia minispora EC-137 TaxID=1314806 RepID=A0ACB8QLC4_9AGAM|nr:hypothetical protein K488DRAFT_49700 [Vararia minispora EC-137]